MAGNGWRAAMVVVVAVASGACTQGDASEVGFAQPWGQEDCEAAAQVAERHRRPAERRRAVVRAVASQGIGDTAYRELAETCVRLRCPMPSPSPADGPSDAPASLPIDHGDLGPDAAWPCATGDTL